ncbi:Y+L amino acid transporter 2 [Brachionus plicatilis]|uniref:Y+L amino acid transporter 2 n=1 Tax=Brachionus plicatilis TaxID=10195 RepID=A0A3M7T6F9_BRAPC|nr:Y+L amino acid transporter 2 [Brachionus plicatilis]
MGEIKLEKNLKLFNCISILIGIVVGTGIFITPKIVLEHSGSIGITFIMWIACGLFSMFGAIAYTGLFSFKNDQKCWSYFFLMSIELGCMIPKAGGEYEYLMVAFGKLPGFLFIWTFIIIILPATFALTALTFSDYALQPVYINCSPPASARILLAAVAMLIITLVNCVSVRLTNLIQNIFNIGKILGLFMIISIGAYCLMIGRVENFSSPFENSVTHPGELALAFYNGLYSYSGWSFLNYVIEEIKEPNKVLPMSIFLGLGGVILIYVFANIAYFTLLNPFEIIKSSAVAYSFVEKIFPKLSWIISIFVCLSTLGYINGALFSASRTIFGAARNNHMPLFLAFINIKFLTPITSILFMAFSSLIFLIFDDIEFLVKISMLSEYIFIGSTVGGLLWLRKTQPKVFRPIRVNLFFPITFLIMCLFTIVMTIWISIEDSIKCIGLISIGIPIYFFFVVIEKPKSIQRKIDIFTVFVQKLTYSVFDDSSE